MQWYWSLIGYLTRVNPAGLCRHRAHSLSLCKIAWREWEKKLALRDEGGTCVSHVRFYILFQTSILDSNL